MIIYSRIILQIKYEKIYLYEIWKSISIDHLLEIKRYLVNDTNENALYQNSIKLEFFTISIWSMFKMKKILSNSLIIIIIIISKFMWNALDI